MDWLTVDGAIVAPVSCIQLGPQTLTSTYQGKQVSVADTYAYSSTFTFDPQTHRFAGGILRSKDQTVMTLLAPQTGGVTEQVTISTTIQPRYRRLTGPIASLACLNSLTCAL